MEVTNPQQAFTLNKYNSKWVIATWYFVQLLKTLNIKQTLNNFLIYFKLIPSKSLTKQLFCHKIIVRSNIKPSQKFI